MNAIELLKQDHERLKGLFEELTKTTERGVKKRAELLGKIELELTLHTHIEEDILYPAFKEAGSKEEDVMYYEAKEEHRAVEALVLPDLKATDPATPAFAGRAKVCKEMLEHHIEEEEEEMFPKAQELLGDKLDEIGVQMEQLKQQLKKELARKAA